jgi:hypothetical protein
MDTHSRSSRLLSADRGGIEDAVDRRPRDAGQSVDLAAEGVASSNGYGDPIGASQADRIAQAFRHPLSFAQVHMAGFPDDAGFCKDCNAPLLLPALARVRIRVWLLPPAATAGAWTRAGPR